MKIIEILKAMSRRSRIGEASKYSSRDRQNRLSRSRVLIPEASTNFILFCYEIHFS